jgi:hypothetical protein
MFQLFVLYIVSLRASMSQLSVLYIVSARASMFQLFLLYTVLYIVSARASMSPTICALHAQTAISEVEKGNQFAFASGKSARQEEKLMAQQFK